VIPSVFMIACFERVSRNLDPIVRVQQAERRLQLILTEVLSTVARPVFPFVLLFATASGYIFSYEGPYAISPIHVAASPFSPV
jgi:hypothetical protein